MGSSLISISANLPDLDRIISAIEKANSGTGLPYTKEAVRVATTDVVQQTWIQYASGAQVSYKGGTFCVNSVSGQYLHSIQSGLVFPNDLTGEVSSNCPHADIIENGSPPRDMKIALLNGTKAKMGKNGQRYTTVPFRHGVPGTTGMPAMPAHIYQQAKSLDRSFKNGFMRKAWGLATTGRWNKYTWGGRLGNSSEGGVSHTAPHPGAGYSHKTGRYSGMVKMGNSGHSQYLTFRRVSDNSDPRSWMNPGVKPKPIREAVVENTKPEVLQLIRNGFDMDLYFMGLGGGNG